MDRQNLRSVRIPFDGIVNPYSHLTDHGILRHNSGGVAASVAVSMAEISIMILTASWRQIAQLRSSRLREHPDVDGVYMPCNKWRTASVIERIEQDGGKPVVTNTQARTWEALHGMGMGEPVADFGRLLRHQ